MLSHSIPFPQQLPAYFNNTRMRRHLRRSGLITRNGEIVMENTFRLNMARREHQKHVRDLLAQAIVHKALDMERHRQAEIKKKLEEIAKVELVQRVRSSKGRKGDEDITPYLSPRAPSGRPKSAKQERPRSVASVNRPATAPSKQSGATKKKSAIYVDKEGFPVHRDQAWTSVEDGNDEIDSHNLRELDPYLLNDITQNMTWEEKQTSPYNVDLTLRNPKPPPRPPPGSKKSPRGASSRTVITRDGRRIGPKSNKGSLSLHRKEPAYPHPTQQQTMCDVTVRYRGNNLKLQYEREDIRDEVIIHQQHCGGENLVVFHGLVEPGTDLVFTSRRHRGFPFSLTFFVNQIQVLRLSACCEYKYGPGVILGGRKGHFKFGRVDGGSPCYRCMVEAELARRERQRYKDTQTDEPKPQKEPEPVLETQGTQSDPPPEITRDQSQQANEMEEANYDDEEFEEDDKEEAESKPEDATKAEDKNSEHFFSEPESDAEGKQSEQGYEADSDFEASSIHEEQDEREKVSVQEEIQEEKMAGRDDDPQETPQELNEDVAGDRPDDAILVPDDATLVPDDATLVPDDATLVPEAPYKSEDERQSSRRESNSGSDSGGHNRVFSTSSSSSSSDDEDEKPGAKATQEGNISTSDFSSEDEGEDRTIHIKQEKQGMEKSPAADKTFSSDEDKNKKLEDADVSEESKNENKKAIEDNEPSPLDTQDVDSANEVTGTKEEMKEADRELSNAEDQKDGEPLNKLTDEFKNVFASSDSSSSDENGGKRRRKKKKSKSKSDSSEKSHSSSDTDNSKSFIEKVKAKFASSDSDSSSDNEKNEKRKSDSERSENTDASKATELSRDVESKESEHQDTKSADEQEKNQRLQDDKEPRLSLSGGRKDKEKDKNKEAEGPTDQEEEEENKDLIEKTEDENDDTLGLLDPEDIEKKEKEKSNRDEDSTASPKESEDGKMKRIEEEDEQSESDSELDKELIRNGAEGMEAEDEADADSDFSSQTRGERPKAPEPPQDEDFAGIFPEGKVRTDDMFGPPDSDSDSKSGSEKIEVREDIEAEGEISTRAAEQNQEDEEPMPTISEEQEDGMKDTHRSSDSELDKASVTSRPEEEKSNTSPEEQEERRNNQEHPKDEHPSEVFEGSDTHSKRDTERSEANEVVQAEDPEMRVYPQNQDSADEPMSTTPEENDLKDEEADSASSSKDQASKEQSDDEAGGAQDDASSDKEREEDEEAKGENAVSDEQADDRNSQTGASGIEQVVDQREPTVTKQDQFEDEVDDKKDLKNDDNNGSITSRSSLSDSGSIADGLDKDFKVLNLNAKNLNEDKVPKLSRALKGQKYTNLEYLLLRDNPLTDTGVATVIRALIETHNEATSVESALKLTHFDLGNSRMGDEAAAELGKLLALPNIRLQDLNISESLLSAAGWAQVIDGLKVNKSLITFTAEYAHLSDTSCVMLADVLADHETLRELNIEGNGLGERAGNALAQLVKDNSVITSINMEKDNVISPNIVSEVKEILETGSYVP